MKSISLRNPLLFVAVAAAFGSVANAQVTESTDQPTQPAGTEATPSPGPAPATTAEPTQAPVTPAPTQAATPIDDQKIEQFADAYVAVQTIQSQSAEKLDASQDPAKQQQAQAAVENEMIAAVEKTGLKLDEFNSIVQTMTADADLRARVVAEIRERTGG